VEVEVLAHREHDPPAARRPGQTNLLRGPGGYPAKSLPTRADRVDVEVAASIDLERAPRFIQRGPMPLATSLLLVEGFEEPLISPRAAACAPQRGQIAMRPRLTATLAGLGLLLAYLVVPATHAAASSSSLASTVTASQVSAGGTHTCAVTPSGGVACWGRNYWGQLGDGKRLNALNPVNVSGLTSGVAVVSAGVSHTCAMTTAGAAMCWGLNTRGQLGDGTKTRSEEPVAVSGLGSGVAQISAGGFFTCAVTTAVRCCAGARTTSASSGTERAGVASTA
jgi:hypothetical protein